MSIFKFSDNIILNVFFSDFPFVFINAIGVTAGAHRYYTHKCFKMKFPLRVFLVLAYASAGMVMFDTFKKGLPFYWISLAEHYVSMGERP